MKQLFPVCSLLIVLCSCGSDSKNAKSNIKEDHKDHSVSDIYFYNLFLAEPLNPDEMESRKRELIKLCLISWLIDPEQHSKQARRLLQKHSNREEVNRYLSEYDKGVFKMDNNHSFIQGENGDVFFIIPGESNRMQVTFGADGKGVNDFIDFVFEKLE